jgi:hypothetical protein
VKFNGGTTAAQDSGLASEFKEYYNAQLSQQLDACSELLSNLIATKKPQLSLHKYDEIPGGISIFCIITIGLLSVEMLICIEPNSTAQMFMSTIRLSC